MIASKKTYLKGMNFCKCQTFTKTRNSELEDFKRDEDTQKGNLQKEKEREWTFSKLRLKEM